MTERPPSLGESHFQGPRVPPMGKVLEKRDLRTLTDAGGISIARLRAEGRRSTPACSALAGVTFLYIFQGPGVGLVEIGAGRTHKINMTHANSSPYRSPKQRQGSQPAWYSYYAGYAPAFVQDVLTHNVTSTEGSRVLDPWNGSGTTTSVASRQGIHSTGVDLNPALIVISKARQLAANIGPSLSPLADQLLANARDTTHALPEEPTEAWMAPSTASQLRRIERTIHRTLVENNEGSTTMPVDVNTLTPLASFFYCSLFLTIRELTKPFRSSNPTWIRRPNFPSDRLKISRSTVESEFKAAVTMLTSRLALDEASQDRATIELGDASAFSGSTPFDLIIGSPPYCTRIDYVIATLPELTILGFDKVGVANLRRRMHGTTLMRSPSPEAEAKLGTGIERLLMRIANHPSQSSANYYAPYFRSYFVDLFSSLQNLESQLTPNGAMGLVVQDSYYKEIPVDLPALVMQFGSELNLVPSRYDFRVSHTMGSINPHSKKYRRSSRATESLILLRRA